MNKIISDDSCTGKYYLFGETFISGGVKNLTQKHPKKKSDEEKHY
jgi:hypothetical protein